MAADINLMPNNDHDGGSPPDLSIRADPSLEAAGWERRHMVDHSRAMETTALYESLGFEVLNRELSPDDFGPHCNDCAAVACKAYVLIYTRRKPRTTGAGADTDKAGTDETQDPV